MQTIKKILKNRLAGARKVAVLGVGSELRGDDVAGLLASQELEKKSSARKKRRDLKIFFGATAPENLTGQILKFAPSHIIIIDTVEIGEKPGTILVLRPDELGGGATFSTHMMPSRVMVNYFLKSLNCNITIIGIQPASIRFGENTSKDVRQSAKDVALAIYSALPE